MLLKTLKSVLRSALRTVESECDWRVTGEHVLQVDEIELECPLLATAKFEQGPLEGVVLGCDQELADHALKFHEQEEARLAALREEEENDYVLVGGEDFGDGQGEEEVVEEPAAEGPTGGFSLLCQAFRRYLSGELGIEFAAEDLVVKDPRLFQAGGGGRNFHILIPTQAGNLQILAAVAFGGEVSADGARKRKRFSDKAVIPGENSLNAQMESEREIQEVLVRLAKLEDEVYLRVPSRGQGNVVFGGTAVRLDTDEEGGGNLLVSSPCLAEPRPQLREKTEVTVLFIQRGRLQQFKSQVTQIAQVMMGKEAYLPLVALRIPTKIGPGQRRDAFRIFPLEEISGKILSHAGTEEPGRGKSIALVFRVVDLSFVGARVELSRKLTEETLPEAFTEGNEVSLRLDLAAPAGRVEVEGMVQRLISPQKGDEQGLQLGIKLVADGRKAPGSLEKIRRFVMDQERKILQKRRAGVVND